MATETRTDGRPANQMAAQAQSRTEAQARTEPWRTEPYDPGAVAQPMGPQVQEIRPTGDETKGSFKTSEFWIYLAAVGGILIASYAVGTTANHSDYFRADKAWWFIALLTIGYLVSRGLAKAGSSTRSRTREHRRD
jgi:hypothetical protein